MESNAVMIGLIQTVMSEDPDANLAAMVGKVRTAASAGARIICLPELYRTRYFPRDIGRDVTACAEPVPGPSSEAFSRIAADSGVVIIVPVFERTTGGILQNTVLVIDADGTILPSYTKVHIPQDPGFFEKGYFAPGTGYRVCKTRFCRIAPLICYDQWFPEAARTVSLMGADLIVYPTAIGDLMEDTPPEGAWQDAWETIQRGHAIANSVHVAAVNRAGSEGNIRFFGGSFVCDALGSVLGRAGHGEEILTVPLDLSMNDRVRESWGFMRNRRPDTYHLICQQIRGTGADSVSSVLHDTPRNRGYHMPAEWEPHEAVWISWPHNTLTFPSLSGVEDGYIAFIRAVHAYETVRLLVRDEDHDRVSRILHGAGVDVKRVELIPARYADVWIRDYGPTFVVNRGEGQVGMVRWNFNAWGDKYDELLADGEIPRDMHRSLGLPLFQPGIVLEGGSVDVNGRGTVLTTRACLLNPNRNPSLSQEEIEEYLGEYLGVVKVIWLGDGVAGDDTDGHIDDIARFVGPSTVVCAFEDDPGDENYAPLKENYDILSESTDQDGTPLTVVKLPMPRPVSDEDGRYPASYTNFYIANQVVVVPLFGDPADSRALEILGDLFPDRQVVGIPARAMVEGYGTFHCATQQQPLAGGPYCDRYKKDPVISG